MDTRSWMDDLAGARGELGRASTAGRVAAILRGHITEGRLLPGTRLSEEEIGAALGVSRNTLREAFRQLSHERLLVHEFNRGVFVRRLTVDDVHDLYRFRRLLEGAVLRSVEAQTPLDEVRRAVEAGESAASERRWVDVGTANMQFHQALAALSQSPRVEEAMRHVLAELRLVFHVMAAPEDFHAPYLADNRRILDLLASGEGAGAADALVSYLEKAEQQLTEAYSRT